MPFPKLQENISNDLFVALGSDTVSAAIGEIGEKFALDEDTMPVIGALVTHLFTKTVPLSHATDILEEYIDLTKDEARQLMLAILLKILYPYWPLYPEIDETITSLGGEVPKEKPPMPRLSQEPIEAVSYPKIEAQAVPQDELFGGIEIPMPPTPKNGDQRPATGNQILDRDVPWMPQIKSDRQPVTSDRQNPGMRTVAKPTDVAKLLEKNLLKEDG